MIQLKEGMPAPLFNAVDQTGKDVSLQSFIGKKVILYFYPKDDTPGCTAQACNLRDHHQKLKDHGYEIIGISPDSVKSHVKFSGKYELPFPLIADTEKTILQAYSVWGSKKFMGRVYDGVHRTTFVIDEVGIIIKIFDKVDTKNHTDQIISAMESLKQ